MIEGCFLVLQQDEAGRRWKIQKIQRVKEHLIRMVWGELNIDKLGYMCNPSVHVPGACARPLTQTCPLKVPAPGY